MGLAITKALVEAHGGWIDVASKLNEGTIFTVMLPGWDETAENAKTEQKEGSL